MKLYDLKKLILAIIVFLVVLFGLYDLNAVAASSPTIKFSMKIGYDDMVKAERGYPIKITLENTSDDFSGSMIIPFYASYDLGGSKQVKVDLPANSKKTYEITIPAVTDYHPNSTTDEVVLYKGEWKNENKVKVNGSTKMTPRILEVDDTTIGLLSKNPDRMKELNLVTLNGSTTFTVPLTKDNFPIQSEGLDFFDLIMIDDYSISELSDPQQLALQNWVKEGGLLISALPQQGKAHWGSLADDIPFDIKDQTLTTQLNFLELNKDLQPNFTELAISTGVVSSEAEVKVATESGQPVIVKKAVGKGAIVQTAFSLGDKPLSSWEGYTEYLQTLIRTNYIQTGSNGYGEGKFESIRYTIANVNELFSSNTFSLGLVLAIVIGYIFILIPLLYIILRKLEKREHSWWLIPSVSIVLSICIFTFGAKDRLAKPQVSEMGIYSVNENKDLSGHFTVSLFTNKGGDYEIVLPKQNTVVPVLNNGGLFDVSTHSAAVINESSGSTDISFPNVEYWSARSVVGTSNYGNVGQFAIDIDSTSSHLKGNISNELPYDFTEMYIWSGFSLYELGPLKKGETLEVDQKMKENILSAPLDFQSGNYQQNQELEEMKKEGLQQAILQLGTVQEQNLPIVFGYTTNKIGEYKLQDRDSKDYSMNVVYQPFQSKGSLTGEFTIENEQMLIEMNTIDGYIYEPLSIDNYIGLENGTYEASYTLPTGVSTKDTRYDTIIFDQYESMNLSVLNSKTGEYVSVDQDGQKPGTIEEAGPFISEEGKIIVKLEIRYSEPSPYIQLPTITVKGVVN